MIPSILVECYIVSLFQLHIGLKSWHQDWFNRFIVPLVLINLLVLEPMTQFDQANLINVTGMCGPCSTWLINCVVEYYIYWYAVVLVLNQNWLLWKFDHIHSWCTVVDCIEVRTLMLKCIWYIFRFSGEGSDIWQLR